MLHILWLILKWILIVLGGLLGLLLLAVLLILFCPVRYRAEGEKRGEDALFDIRGTAEVSWLFHIFSVKAAFSHGTVSRQIRIFGIPLDVYRRLRSKRKNRTIPEPRQDALSSGRTKSVSETRPAAERTEPPDRRTKARLQESGPLPEEPQKEAPHKAAEKPKAGKTAENEKEESTGRLWERIKKIPSLPARMFGSIRDGICGFFEKIRKTALTFRKMYDKIEWWKEFLSHPRTQEAVSLVWKDVKALVRHILPTRTDGLVTFGNEDPAVTGSVLAFLGMTIPFHKNRIEIVPLFEGENYLEGAVRLSGRIYGWMLLKTAAGICFDKNVKYVIRRWRHKEV